MNNYVKVIQADHAKVEEYYLKSVALKTEQQKFLESLIKKNNCNPLTVIDVSCGGGGTCFHLSKLFDSKTQYTLIDLNPAAIEIAKNTTKDMNARCTVSDLFKQREKYGKFDLVLCMQTLMVLDNPFDVIEELLKLCSPSGKVIISSLFNENHDVNITSSIEDLTRPSSLNKLKYEYNTYAVGPIIKKFKESVKSINYYPFSIGLEIPSQGRGIGTYTHKLSNGKFIEISGGVLMNWGFLEIIK
jgi:ubiquinone/menaquinone biosynthesis C-methylase UbiE